MNLGRIGVLERVRRQRAAPERGARLWKGAAFARVDQERSVAIPSHEMAEREDVEDARPPMRVHLDGFTGRNPRLQYADDVVLEEDSVRFGAAASASSESGHDHGSAPIAERTYSAFSAEASSLPVGLRELLRDLPDMAVGIGEAGRAHSPFPVHRAVEQLHAARR
jgi:hypothetical protein